MNYIEINQIHPSWSKFFTPEIYGMLEEIDGQMSGDCNPSPQGVLRFAQQPLDQVKVLILGQDTYPAQGVATGRAFEVGGLTSWQTKFQQVSLKNIVRRLYGDYTGGDGYTKITEINPKIASGDFPILPPDALFQSWADQGVLLLNTALSCRVGQAGSHVDIWRPFSQQLLDFIARERTDIHVFLWGNFAQGFAHCFPTQVVHQSRHPMMCSRNYPDDFLKFTGFQETSQLICWLGR